MLPDLVIIDCAQVSDLFIQNARKIKKIHMPGSLLFITTAHDDMAFLMSLYSTGVDEIFLHPFNLKTLELRLLKLMCNDNNLPEFIRHIKINRNNFTVYGPDSVGVQLTPKEFQILMNIFEKPEYESKRSDLTEIVWNKTAVVGKTLDVHLCNLRKKLQPLNLEIRFVFPDTYRLSPKSYSANIG